MNLRVVSIKKDLVRLRGPLAISLATKECMEQTLPALLQEVPMTGAALLGLPLVLLFRPVIFFTTCKMKTFPH